MNAGGQRAAEQMRVKRLREAADWLLLLEGPGRTEEDTNEWLRWCDADPKNVAAFEHLQRHWRDLDALKGGEGDFTHPSGQKIAPSALEIGTGRRFSTGIKAAVWALAVSIAVIAFTVALVERERTSSASPQQQVSAMELNRAATLPDGSKVILGAKTLVNVDFNGAQRQLDLAMGEAYFKVKHDKHHPFVVRAGEVSVTAVGTAFDVRRLNDKVSVTVEEGTVEVTSNTASTHGRPATWRAEAGYQVTYSNESRTASIATVDPATALAWRSGELAYIRESLGSVIEDLNRYSARKIIIQDPEIANLRFTGTAFASSLDDWVRGVEQAYPVSARATATGDIVLTQRR